jgi:hypothetical protein
MAGQPSSRAERLARHLIRLACLRLSGETREDRYREWAAELHAILADPETSSRTRRNARALLYAADQNRGARRLGRATRDPMPRPPFRARARKLLQTETPGARILVVTVLTLISQTGDWIFMPHGILFVTTAAVGVSCYVWTVARFKRESRPHFLQDPEDRRR